ncbi:hypothetical protein OEZ85_012932 [Tetradesmus obliquus]|uniref:UPF3 domain-containing protein n=1 Tax=Tetradesmus obliquus TaxID=3088 RepID=A0ABY8U4T8_TETOB|nr:hypothetical protein OEZ85_012932 [Tetradesmus obliquus]
MSKASTERTKVVVRNLPPTLSREAFLSAIEKHAEGTYNWLAYYPGKVSLKRTMFSRAFLNINSPEAVLDFKARFDGHVFVSSRGTQYRCSVEYAPFQKVPTAHPKKLAMEGTIDKDPDYVAFVEALEQGPKALPTAQAQLEAQEAARGGEAAAPVVTALMAFLQAKYEAVPFTGRRTSRKEAARLRKEAAREAAAAAAAAANADRASKGSRAKASRSSSKPSAADMSADPSRRCAA